MLAAAQANQAKAEDLKQKAAAKAADLGTQLDAAKADGKAKLDAASAVNAAAAARAAPRLMAPVQKLEWLKTRADAELAVADRVLAAAKTNQAKAEDMKQKAAAKAAELGTQLDTAKADAKSKLDAAAAAQNADQDGRGQAGRRRQGGARGKARARAGLALHQPLYAAALCAARLRGGLRGAGHDPQF